MSEAGQKVELTKFETGAVRSTERQGFRYDLITPVGLKAMANWYKSPPKFNDQSVQKHLSNCLFYTYEFLANPGTHRDLYAATDCLFQAVAVFDHELQDGFISKDELNYHMIPRSPLRRIAAAYDEGAKKYSAFNCEKGMPVGDILNHALAHIFDWLSGNTDEDHLGHACWNYMMAIHNLFLFPSLDHGLRETPVMTKGFDFDV